MEQYTLLFRGAPIGTVRGSVADWVGGGDLLPLPSFDAVRASLADASRVLANYGFFPPAGQLAGGVTSRGEQAGANALAAAQAICNDLELRDAHGRLIPYGLDQCLRRTDAGRVHQRDVHHRA